MWKYTAENDYPNISLHDCRISNVLIGYVWFKKKPYEYECQIRLFFNTMIYSWNKICEDRPW